MMKLAKLAVPCAALLLAAACGNKSKPAVGNAAGAAHVPGDVDGDGQADEVSFADGVVSVAGQQFTVPADFNGVGAHVVELGTEAIVVVESEVVEDDLTWRVLQWRGGQLHNLGDVFVGGRKPAAEDLPGDGTIHAGTGNCGQHTTLVYKIVDGKIEKDEQTTGTYDETQCAACPYVLVDTGAGLAFVGESLRNLSSPAKAAEDTLTLPALTGQRELVVVLSEVKPETTYLDAIAVDFDGTRVAPRGCAGAACADDDAHEIFTLGERRRFVFDVPAGFTGQPVLHTRGYYQPFTPTVAR